MGGFLQGVYQSLFGATSKWQQQAIDEQLNSFRTFLNNGTHAVVRFWVESGASYGHQAATAALVYRLAMPTGTRNQNFAYTGTIEIYYEEATDLPKLQALIPELNNTPPVIGAATLRAILKSARPTVSATLGITGGANANLDYTDLLNVDTFLRLQPYRWPGPEQIQIRGQRDPIDLTTIPQLGTGFKNRLLYDDPARYANPPFSDFADYVKAQIINEICNRRLDVFTLLTTYSIKSDVSRLNTNAPYGAALVCGSALCWQKQNGKVYKNAEPLIILNFDDFGTPTASEENNVRAILSGGIAPAENSLTIGGQDKKNPVLRSNLDRRKAFFKSLGVLAKDATGADRFTYVNCPQTLQAVTDELDRIAALPTKNEQVVFIQLGRVQPQVFFNFAMLKSTLPPLFEGQNTTNTAVNMGIPFMQVPAPELSVEKQAALYPSVAVGALNPDAVPAALVKVARQINSSNAVWPESPSEAPCLIVGNYYREVTESKPTDTLYVYFTNLKQFYSNAWEDKFCLAVAYLNTVLQPRQPAPAVQLAAAAGADDNPLNDLYAKLQKQVVIGQSLNLVPGVINAGGGNIGGYLIELIADYGAVLSLVVQTFGKQGDPPNVEQITLSGTSDLFQKLGVQCDLTVIFTAPDNELTSDITFVRKGSWSLANAPWIVLRDAFVHILAPNRKMPVMASIGGYYPPMESTNPSREAKLEIAVNNDHQWSGGIAFTGNYPGIATAFQMAASINLVQSLPAPFNVLTDLGISNVDFQYDYDKSVLNSVMITAQTNSPSLKLMNSLALSNLNVTTTLLNPASNARSLTVATSADFIIGGPDPAATISISVGYPGLTLQGTLTNGTITVGNLVSTFLPSGYTLSLPQAPTIDQFAFSYTQQTDLLNITLNLNINWTFTFFNKDLFTVDNVGFAITRSAGANTGFLTGNMLLLPNSAKIGLSVGAFYLGNSTWQFSANQTSGVVSINDLLTEYLGPDWKTIISFPDLAGLRLQMDWAGGKASSFEFAAQTAKPWTPITVLPQVTVTGNALIGYSTDRGGKYGTLSAEIKLWNIDLQVAYDFDPKTQKLCVKWLGLQACLSTNGKGETVAVFSINNKSLGDMVEMFVSWATGASFGLSAPWDVLNDITLNGVTLTYNFSNKSVDFSVGIGSLDFGIFSVKAITVKYDSTQQSPQKVSISIDGSFPWDAKSPSNQSWFPTDPSSTPAPPGGGNKYLDLRMLALGQHVTVNGLTQQRQVQDVIAMLRSLTIPKPPEIPVGGPGQPVFLAESSWFVAMDFGVLKAEPPSQDTKLGTALALKDDTPPVYFLQMSIVFNDPVLYALQIALDGPMAKIFAGLNFQIMYRQISDTVGCYSAQIALPNIMRTFEIGVATITLPVFGIEIYTNGDFQVDIGFPWQMDFSRSFTIAVIVAGIPVLGSAGFYFGKLSSATTNKVPTTSLGWFNPVLVFGFGAQIGLGKQIDAGILKAGFSITIFGIIEGVLARWLPYTLPTSAGDKNQLQDGYFFSITGTFGLQGRLYGSVDFVIIKGTVDVSISMYFRIVFTSYEPILISASASVSVSVSLEIDLGLFSITISFSFSATVSAQFTLENPMGNNPPWGVPAQIPAPMLLEKRRLQRVSASARLLKASQYNPTWSNLQQGTLLTINGWVAPVFTVAGDVASSAADQAICYAINFLLPTTAPVHITHPTAKTLLARAAYNVDESNLGRTALERARHKSELLRAGQQAYTFEDLAIRVLEWILAAGMGSYTPDSLGNQIVTVEFLQDALAYLSTKGTTPVIPADQIENFLTNQTQIVFAVNKSQGQASGAFFPAPPGTVLSVPQYPAQSGAAGFQYAFGEFNSSSPSYIHDLNEYFAQLMVQMQQQGGNPPMRLAATDQQGPSVASFTFSDYFAVIGRQMVEALLNGLKNYKLVIDTSQNVQQIVDGVNNLGSEPGKPQTLTTPAVLFHANRDHALSIANSKSLTIRSMAYTSPGQLSFTDIAALAQFKAGFDAKSLALANAADNRILAPSVTVTFQGSQYITQNGDSLKSIADHLKTDPATLLSSTDLLTDKSAVSTLAVLAVPDFAYSIAGGDTLSSVTVRFGVTLDELAEANTGVIGLFDNSSDPNLNVPELAQFQISALLDELRRTLALQGVASMTSRFYLSGLRLPTDGLTPNYPSLFVNGTSSPFTYKKKELGLFALTGQVFPLPPISGISPAFTFTLTRGGSENWLNLGTAGSATVNYALDDKNDFARYQSLQTYAQGNVFRSGMTPIEPLDAAAVQPARYPLAQRMAWQTPVAIVLPQQPSAPANPQPSLWQLPNPLINLPRPTALLPRFAPMVTRTDHATGNTVESPVANFGFGTLIQFSVRRTPPAAGSSASARCYELIGATENDTVILERLLNALQGDDSSFQQMLLLYPPASTGSKTTGWQSDDQTILSSGPLKGQTVSLVGIGQVNLSTETHPPTSLNLMAAAVGQTAIPNVINKPTEFLRLLWEASITRSGGFFLSYTTAIGSNQLRGLPDRIFADGDVAHLAVLSLFNIDPLPPGVVLPNPSQCVAGYMNVVATNEPLDLRDAALIAEAVEVPFTPQNLTQAADTLTSLAAQYYTDISLLVTMNPDAVLAGTITVPSGRYEVPPAGIAPGGDLNAIAAHFNTTVDDLKLANPNRTDWPNPLAPYTGLMLPAITVRIGTDPGGTTCRTLAAYYNAPMAGISAANANVPGFFATGEQLNVSTGPITLAPLVQAGVAGFHTSRTAPAPLPQPTDPNFADWGKLYVQHLFNLLGYRVTDNPDFKLSAWGLPAGPAAPKATPTKDKIQAPLAPAAGDPWVYTRTLPYPALYKPIPPNSNSTLPSPADSPYLGVGGLLQFELEWQDIFGNLIVSDLTRPQSADTWPSSPPSQITGFTDALLGIGQWPAVANAYRFVPDKNSKPALELMLQFDTSQFLGKDPQLRIQHALNTYTKVLFQLGEPNLPQIGITTNVLLKTASPFSDAMRAQLVQWVESIYLWLQSLSTSSAPPALNPSLTIAVSLADQSINPGQIFRVTASVNITRNAHLVEGQLATAAGVGSTATVLAPWTGPLGATVDGHNHPTPEMNDYNYWRTFTGNLKPTDPANPQRDIAAFAHAFTAAFSSMPDATLHIATGADSNSYSMSAQNNLWAVQIGDPQKQGAISYKVDQPNAPKQFAPRPISNKLISRPTTPVIAYTTGKVIAPADPSNNVNFAGVDLDQWMQTALTQIDSLLTPRYVAPALILRSKFEGSDALQMLLDAKGKLASALQSAMIPVFDGETASTPELSSIQDAFRQSMLARLSQYYAVKAGIQFSTTVNAAIARNPGDTDPPRLYGNTVSLPPVVAPRAAAEPGDSGLPSNFSLSSLKLSLSFADPSAIKGKANDTPHLLSMLLSSTTSTEASVTLNLEYSCQYIEHEISQLPGIQGYQPSTWLSFADDTSSETSKWPLNAVLGQFDVPLVLRAFPQTPTLVQQSSIPAPKSECYKGSQAQLMGVRPLLLSPSETCSQPGNYNPLATATLWNYAFTYSLPVHELNDAIHAQIQFNQTVSSRVHLMAAAGRDLFDNLAEFVTEFPKVQADLDAYLAPLDVATTDRVSITNAHAALASAATMVQWIADTATLGSGNALRSMAGAPPLDPYNFTITEESVTVKDSKGDPVEGVLRITVALPAPPPPRVGTPLVQIAGYNCQPYATTAPYSYCFVYTDANGQYLLASTARSIAQRTFILPDLNVLERQDAEISLYLTRNQNLAGHKIADVFVYTTPTVSLPDPLLPTLNNDDAINLATINAQNGSTPVARSFSCQLAQLYSVLFANSGTDSVTLTLATYYEYDISSQVPAIRLPATLIPPTQVAVRDGGTGQTLDQLIAAQVAGCEGWFNTMQPSTANASFFFDITIMSNLTAKPMPVLHLSGLTLPLADIVPPLSNISAHNQGS